MPDDTLKTAEQVLKQTQAEGLKPFAGSEFDTGEPISRPSNIESPYFTATPAETPMRVPAQIPSTSVVGDLGSIDERARQAGEQAVPTEQVTESQKATQDALAQIADLLGQPGEQGLTRQAEKEAGVSEAEKELQDVNNQILQEQVALRRREEAIRKNPTGMLAGAVEAEVQRAQRESYAKQADLAVIQMAKQGRYDSAKAMADRAVAIQMEEKKSRLDVLSLIYQENKDIFTKQEQRQFEAKQAERERLLDREEENLKDISDLSLNALQNGAPAEVVTRMRNAQTLDDAILIGGNYINAYDRAIKAAQLKGLSEADETKLTGDQSKALGFGRRMFQASTIIDEIGSQFTGAGSYLAGMVPNLLKSSDRQRYEQAQRNFINAVLRRESGAAIGEDEFDNARLQYFPQAGDSQEVLLQKKQNRDLATKNLLEEAGQDTSVQDASLQDPLEVGVSPSSANPLGI